MNDATPITASPTYRHWRANLARKQAGEPLLDIHDGDPKCGYYRAKRKGAWVAAFIRYGKTGTLVAAIGNDIVDPHAMWLEFADEPIGKETCEHWYATGRWPGEEAKPAQAEEGRGTTSIGAQSDEAPPPAGHNNPPSDLVAQMAETLEGASGWLKKTKAIETDEAKQIAVNKVGLIRDVVAKAKKAHKAEKAPHLEAGQLVDKKYNPTIKALEDASAKLLRLIDDHTNWVNAKIEAERAALEAKHAKQAAKAEAKGKEAPPPPELPAVTKTIESHTGRALSQREVPVLKLLPPSKGKSAPPLEILIAHLGYDQFEEFAMQLANQEWKRTGEVPPGCHVITTTKTV